MARCRSSGVRIALGVEARDLVRGVARRAGDGQEDLAGGGHALEMEGAEPHRGVAMTSCGG